MRSFFDVDRTILLVIVLFTSAMGVEFWRQHWLHKRLLHTMSFSEAGRIASTLKTIRELHAKDLVAARKSCGIGVSSEQDTPGGSFSLPVTYSMKLDNGYSEEWDGGSARIFSPYPFPASHRKGLEGSFEHDAWKALHENPDQPYTQDTEIDGHLMLRYAVADRMTASCVECHNSHPQSPERDSFYVRFGFV